MLFISRRKARSTPLASCWEDRRIKLDMTSWKKGAENRTSPGLWDSQAQDLTAEAVSAGTKQHG